MKHHEAVEYLLDLAEGSLQGELRASVAAHAATCSACQDWLETFDSLARQSPLTADRDHPDVESLARYTVHPNAMNEMERYGIEAHLESCSACTQDLTLVRAAVRNVRAGASEEPVQPWTEAKPRWRRYWKELTAAVLALAVAGAGWMSLGAVRRSPEVSTIGGLGEVSGADSKAGKTEDLSGVDLVGTRSIETDSGLRISDLKVKKGASITIRAGGGVAFGDGFQVEGGASLAVDGSDYKHGSKDLL